MYPEFWPHRRRHQPAPHCFPLDRTPDAHRQRGGVPPPDRPGEIGDDMDALVAGLASDVDLRGEVAEAAVIDLEEAVVRRRMDMREVIECDVEILGMLRSDGVENALVDGEPEAENS